MLIVDEINARDIYSTIVVEFAVPEKYDEVFVAHKIYDLATKLEDDYIFFADMVFWHDITLYRSTKPLPHALAHHATLVARFSNLVARKHNLTVDTWQAKLLACLRMLLPINTLLSDDDTDEHSLIKPIVTVYNQPGKSFCLT